MKPHIVLVRDPRKRVGGFESWTEMLANGLPHFGVDVTLVIPANVRDEAVPRDQFTSTQKLFVDASDDCMTQVRSLLNGLQKMAQRSNGGVFFTMSYPYINIAGLNLKHSPWLPIPVLHGRHPSAFDWICVGPPKRIVVPSEDFAGDCRGYLQMKIGRIRSLSKVVTIPHGVSVPDAIALTKTNLGDSPQTLRLIAVSRFNEDVKRPWDYLAIAAELRRRGVDFQLVLVGDGPCLEAMKQYAEDHALGHHVRFEGAVSRQRVYSFLQASDLLLSTSESEAFGLAVAEGLACGCAVVSSDIPGPIQKMVTERTGIRVPVGDVQAFADAIQWLDKNRPLVRAMGMKGHELIKKQFSDTAMLAAYARLIRKLCKGIRPNPNWSEPSRLLLNPGEAVSEGIMAKLGIPSYIRQRIRSRLKKA